MFEEILIRLSDLLFFAVAGISFEYINIFSNNAQGAWLITYAWIHRYTSDRGNVFSPHVGNT